jgi:hypothetical protein
MLSGTRRFARRSCQVGFSTPAKSTKAANALRSNGSVAPISRSSLTGLLGRRLFIRAESSSRQIRWALWASGAFGDTKDGPKFLAQR